MKQPILGYGNLTRKREFQAQMERVVPWAALVAPFVPEGRRGRPPFPVDTILRTYIMPQWFTPSNPAMEDSLHDVPLFREFAGLGGWSDRLPDESPILRFRHLLEKHNQVSTLVWLPPCKGSQPILLTVTQYQFLEKIQLDLRAEQPIAHLAKLLVLMCNYLLVNCTVPGNKFGNGCEVLRRMECARINGSVTMRSVRRVYGGGVSCQPREDGW